MALAAGLAFAAGCGSPTDAREDVVVAAILECDEDLLRQRAHLVRDKYARMGGELYDYFRGSMCVHLADARVNRSAIPHSSFFPSPPILPGLGDAHVENFGTMRASDGSFALEPNDLDAADRWPFLWDLRRLLTSLAVASQGSNLDDASARADAIANATHANTVAVAAYLDTLHRRLSGELPQRVVESLADDPILTDAFTRSNRDDANRRELATYTELTPDGGRRFRIGVKDDDPTNTLEPLATFARAGISEWLQVARRELLVPHTESYFAVLDAVREYGSGVASLPRVRVLVLVEGPSGAREDDVVLEVKETSSSGADAWTPPGPIAGDNATRIRLMSHAVWSRPDADPLATATSWYGMPVILRTESDAFKTLRVSRLEGARGTPEALDALAAVLGAMLARVHTSDLERDREALTSIDLIGAAHRDAFALEEAQIATRYADLVVADFGRFQHAIATRGPLLGARVLPGANVSRDVTALFGVQRIVAEESP